jgi:hypothetical protein
LSPVDGHPSTSVGCAQIYLSGVHSSPRLEED